MPSSLPDMMQCKSTLQTYSPTVMQVDLNLHELCIEKIARWLKSAEDVSLLPLPKRLKDRLIQYINE